ncbi:MAG: hypothetical protein WC702_03015 [Patescibacteria group bacterium]|jgi:hypothetical protein
MADQREIGNRIKKNLSKEEKAVFVLLAIIGILGVTFGFKSFSASLSRPFEVQLANYQGEKFLTLSEQEAAAVELQKTTDSDSDGLMDYDELYIYKTSPYLADSDSDGFDDNTEIFSNNNPNCPEGKDCSASTLVSAEETSDSEGSDLLSQLLGMGNGTGSSLTFESTDEITDYFSNMGADQVRSILITQGVPKDTVDKMSDEEVMALLQTALAQAETSGELDSLISPDETATSTGTVEE